MRARQNSHVLVHSPDAHGADVCFCRHVDLACHELLALLMCFCFCHLFCPSGFGLLVFCLLCAQSLLYLSSLSSDLLSRPSVFLLWLDLPLPEPVWLPF